MGVATGVGNRAICNSQIVTEVGLATGRLLGTDALYLVSGGDFEPR